MEDSTLLGLIRKLDYYGCVSGSMSQLLSDIQLFTTGKVNQDDFEKLFKDHFSDLSSCIEFIIEELDENLRQRLNDLLNKLKELTNEIKIGTWNEKKANEVMEMLKLLRESFWKKHDELSHFISSLFNIFTFHIYINT